MVKQVARLASPCLARQPDSPSGKPDGVLFSSALLLLAINLLHHPHEVDGAVSTEKKYHN
jgi:hypothetical protein